MPLTPKEIIRKLKQNGFIIISQNGSHVKLKNPESGKQVIVPYHSRTGHEKGLGASNIKTGGAKIALPSKMEVSA